VQGARQIKRSYPEAVAVFLAPPSPQELERRLAGRGTDDPNAVRRRLENACREMERVSDYDYLIVNDDLHRAVEALTSIVRAASHRVALVERGALEGLVHSFVPGR